ncbi:MAG: Fe-S cluster assembly sulfur transfer protein SufU [Gammaproteobacteria bacterium]
MSNNLQNIYRETVLNHSRDPHNRGALPDANRETLGFNPLCGDKLHIYIKLQNDRIDDIRFEGTGCAISIASASMMTDALQGQPLPKAIERIDHLQSLLNAGGASLETEIEELHALEGVRDYPSRIKCATLAWTAAAAALQGDNAEISTEK